MKTMIIVCLIALLSGLTIKPQNIQETEIQEYVLVIDEENNDLNSTFIRLCTQNGIQKMNLEDYLVGVVLTEMPPSFELEAMKAQAVAARTFAMNANKHENYDLCTNSDCCQAWRSNVELQNAFAEEYGVFLKKGKQAVSETEGQAIYCDDKLIDAVYFSCSGGMSEPASAVWGNDVPYLQSVYSPGEESCAKYHSQTRVGLLEFKEKLSALNSNVSFAVMPQDWIGKISYSAGGGVASIEFGDATFAGTQIRSLFSLASTKFTAKVQGGEVVFDVNGFGHRVGMSQYGAEAMANAGADYKEILHHYYTDVSIKKLSRT